MFGSCHRTWHRDQTTLPAALPIGPADQSVEMSLIRMLRGKKDEPTLLAVHVVNDGRLRRREKSWRHWYRQQHLDSDGHQTTKYSKPPRLSI